MIPHWSLHTVSSRIAGNCLLCTGTIPPLDNGTRLSHPYYLATYGRSKCQPWPKCLKTQKPQGNNVMQKVIDSISAKGGPMHQNHFEATKQEKKRLTISMTRFGPEALGIITFSVRAVRSSSYWPCQVRAIRPMYLVATRNQKGYLTTSFHIILIPDLSSPRYRLSPSRGCCCTCSVLAMLELGGECKYLIRTRPSAPVCLPSMNSSVSRSSTFMYESMLSRVPLYSVWPHFRRMRTSVLTLGGVSYLV